MNRGNVVKRGTVSSLGHITQLMSARLCGQYKHLRYGRLFVDWKLIFPDEVGILYHPMRLVGGKLWVQTSSTQAALLAYFAPRMVERINQYLGSDVVVSIHAHQSMKASFDKKTRARQLAPLSSEVEHCTQGISQPLLKEALQRWGQWLEAEEKE